MCNRLNTTHKNVKHGTPSSNVYADNYKFEIYLCWALLTSTANLTMVKNGSVTYRECSTWFVPHNQLTRSACVTGHLNGINLNSYSLQFLFVSFERTLDRGHMIYLVQFTVKCLRIISTNRESFQEILVIVTTILCYLAASIIQTTAILLKALIFFIAEP